MKILKIFLGLALIALLAALAGGFYVWKEAESFLSTPANVATGTSAKYYYVTIKPGMSFNHVIDTIFAEGGIADKDKFKLYGRWKKAASQVKAGEFEFDTSWTPVQVLEQLVSGRTLAHKVTIPEGRPWWEVARILETNGFVKASDFEQHIKDPAALASYGIPFNTAEGFLYPDTYMLSRPRTPDMEQTKRVVRTLVQTFWRKTTPMWDEAAKAASLSPDPSPFNRDGVASFVPDYALTHPDKIKHVVILASLVEKETAVPSERPTVAGLYSNRIRKNMLLQCDPTIIYGLGPKFNGTIYRSQIRDNKNLYNTYQHAGLPPGPICAVGISSLKAAFNPEQHDYLFMVATGTGDGKHIFTKTNAEHNRAVIVYRNNLKKYQRQ